MATSILNIGVSGLNAAQAGIQTTSHNISNASTPGFSRQQIVQTTNTPQFSGSGFLGQGTNVATVQRIYSSFLSGQVLSAQAGVSEMDAYQAQISQIDSLLADPSAGLQPALSNFFSGVNDVAANPSSISSRQSMLSSAQSLASSFQALDGRLGEIRDGVNTQIAGSVTNINSYASQLAELNQRIILAEANASGQPANDLLDQRDQLVAQLNKEIRATALPQTDGTYSIFIGNGQPLVIGTQSFTMQALPSPQDQSRTVIAMQAPGGNSIILQESLLTGGTLGGLISFRSQTLDAAQNALGRIAIGVAQTINAQHRLGQDLTGALGGDLFSVASPTTISSTRNTGTGAVTANLGSAANLTTSDYLLTMTAANTFTLTRLSDNTAWTGTGASQAAALTALMANVSASSAGDQGFSLAATGTMNVGDSFTIEPTRTGAQSISVVVTDPRNIAAAAPIRTGAQLGNTGTGSISAGTVTSTPTTLRDNVTITFTSATSFNVVDTTTSTNLAPNVTYNPSAGATVSFNGWSVDISGAPAALDVFTVGPNSNGVSDNRNVLAIGQLQTSKVLDHGSASFTNAYAQLVSSVGNKTRQVQVTGQAQQSLLDQATAAQQSLSGVNLDEEAANLLRYQQAYQASAKVIATASKLFDSILALNA